MESPSPLTIGLGHAYLPIGSPVPPSVLMEAARVALKTLEIPVLLAVVPVVALPTVVFMVEKFGTQPNEVTPLPVPPNLVTTLRPSKNLDYVVGAPVVLAAVVMIRFREIRLGIRAPN